MATKVQARKELAHSALYFAAYEAGKAAGEAKVPQPMVVRDMIGLSNRPDPDGQRYVVPSGVCGFAQVNVRPGTSSFARWLVKAGIGRKAYYGGVDIPIHEHGQSYEQKAAHAGALARVLQAGGVDCRSQAQLD